MFIQRGRIPHRGKITAKTYSGKGAAVHEFSFAIKSDVAAAGSAAKTRISRTAYYSTDTLMQIFAIRETRPLNILKCEKIFRNLVLMILHPPFERFFFFFL